MMHKKDLAKFFSGIAVAKVGFHGVLAASNALPITLLGFTLTPHYNLCILVVWSAIALFLIHYAWFKKH
jgi:hypothetical protein